MKIFRNKFFSLVLFNIIQDFLDYIQIKNEQAENNFDKEKSDCNFLALLTSFNGDYKCF